MTGKYLENLCLNITDEADVERLNEILQEEPISVSSGVTCNKSKSEREIFLRKFEKK